ncbi:MAG: hypothetical protein KDD62_02845, partial [Bdellovibrionales bacterium]|nr:hypothetical protein [Bdellovibrionales bacterium]
LIDFAEKNGFDKICCSQRKAIRTNRVGGEFERALEARIRQIAKTYQLQQEQVFSHKPSYTQRDLDVLWQATSL